jgi:hypothetical protein
MEQNQNNTPASEVAVIDRALPILSSAKTVLHANQAIHSKAMEVFNKLDAQIKANGGQLNAELDEKLNKFIVTARQRREQLEQARKPLTTAMDLIWSSFTKVESDLDEKKSTSWPAHFAKLRNQYATDQAKKKEEERKKIELENNKIKERGTIKADVMQALRIFMIDTISEKNKKRKDYFEGSTLQDLDTRCEQIKERSCKYAVAQFKMDFVFRGRAYFLDQAEVNTIVDTAIQELSAELCERHEKEVGDFTRQLLEQRESKRAELERLHKANAEEFERVEKERQDRLRKEQEEQDRIKQEQLQHASNQSELVKSEAETLTLFNTHNAQAQLEEDVAGGGSREKLIIKVNHIGAYTLIFQLWYTEEAIPQNYTQEDCEKTSLKQMKSFCEKLANRKKDPIKIQSDFLSYQKDIKAINKTAAK